jgi:hypothetical protein
MAVAGAMFYKGVLRHQPWFSNTPPQSTIKKYKSSLSDQDHLLELNDLSSLNLSSSAATSSYKFDSASNARIVGMCEDEEKGGVCEVEYSSRPLQAHNAIADDYLQGPHIESQNFDTIDDSKHFRGRFLLIPADGSDDEKKSHKVGRFEVSCSPTSSKGGPFADSAAISSDHASISDDGYGSLESQHSKLK